MLTLPSLILTVYWLHFNQSAYTHPSSGEWRPFSHSRKSLTLGYVAAASIRPTPCAFRCGLIRGGLDKSCAGGGAPLGLVARWDGVASYRRC
ncbi:hypothetical protein PF010_g30917 [Phytophthora fragariae]|uniref:Secreted protein n=1 Tax=Phytophthora fragariae TaxID=53985 RepID=A0A6A3PKV3_9STRA|nr:hypothetical protein PF006_g32660 [Phytophthora fragariae]KAE9058655.1 hypothetical protein PF010_g30917 [Phytophthora fragariae]KAE9156958.1 hypothetical protein PF004_g32410 [Phytophthora fragariae]KAE9160560.1 hypothetical protein PF002_g32590 [Phytophthora fragariae]